MIKKENFIYMLFLEKSRGKIMKAKIMILGLFILIVPLVCASNPDIVPEFSTITAGVALAGGVIGYKLFKRKKR